MRPLFLFALVVLARVEPCATDNPCAGVLEFKTVGPFVCMLGEVWGILDSPGNHTLSATLADADPAYLVSITSQVRDTTIRFPIPEELGKFTRLVYVFLSYGTTGTLPTSVGLLTSLGALSLQEAEDLGRLPTQLGLLTSLRVLSLEHSPSNGSFPPAIWRLPDMTYVELFGCGLSGSLPPQVGKLMQLINIGLDDNRFEGSLPSELGLLSSLTRISAKNNRLDGLLPSELGSIKPLWELVLSNNTISGTIPSQLGAFVYLERLDLSGNRLTGSLPSELGNLASLTSLSLASNTLTGTLPASLGLLAHLASLDVSHNRLSGPLPRELGALVVLTVLRINDNQFSGNPENVAMWLPNIEAAIGGNRFSGSLSARYSKWLQDCYKSGLSNRQCRVLCDCDLRKFEVEYQQADPMCQDRGCISLGWFLGSSVLLAIVTLGVLWKGHVVPEEGGAARWRGFKRKHLVAASGVLLDTFILQIGALAVYENPAFFYTWLFFCALEFLGAALVACLFSRNVSSLWWGECALCFVAPRAQVPVITIAKKRDVNADTQSYFKYRVGIAWCKLFFSLVELAVQAASSIVGEKRDALVLMTTTSAAFAVLVSWDMVLATKRRMPENNNGVPLQPRG